MSPYPGYRAPIVEFLDKSESERRHARQGSMVVPAGRGRTEMTRMRIIACFALLALVQVAAFSQSGSAKAVARFVDNGDGTITDTSSGLMWQKSPPATVMSWPEAVAWADSLALAGHTDWRLPYRIELRGLVDQGRSDNVRWLASQGFSGLQSAEYWSGTHFSYIGLDYGWVVNMDFGGTHSLTAENPCCVLAVRNAP